MLSKKLILSAFLFAAVLVYGVYAASSGSGSSGVTGGSGAGSDSGSTNSGTSGTMGTGASGEPTGMMGTGTVDDPGTGAGTGTGTGDWLDTRPDTNRNTFGNDADGVPSSAPGDQGLDALSSAGFNQRGQVSAALRSRQDRLNAELQALNSQPQNDDTRRQVEMKQRQLQALDSNIQRVGQASEQDWNDVRDSVLNDDSMR